MSAHPAVGHLVREFLPLTETFIHDQMLHQRRFRAVVLAGAVLEDRVHAWPELENLEDRLGPLSRAATRRLSKPKVLPPPARRALRAAIRERGIACVHAHFGDHAAYYAPGVPADVPLVASFYGYDATSFPRRGRGLGRAILRRLFARSDALLVLSEDMRRDLIALGARPDKIVVHHLGISLERFSFAPAREDGGAGLRLLFVGRLVEKKGVFDLIEALARIRGRVPGLSCDVYGDGELAEPAQRAASAAGLGGALRFHGEVIPGEVPAAMRRADVFVLPSKQASSGDKEGTPVVILEAMASGLPVISTRHAGIPEMIASGHEGLLVPEGDPAALGAALVEAAESPRARAAWARGARAKVEQGFDAVRQAERLEDLYARLISERAARPSRRRGGRPPS